MANSTDITSGVQMQKILEDDKLTIIVFYKDATAVKSGMDALNPVIASLSSKLRLARCDIGKNAWAEAQYQITADPTFIAFKSGVIVSHMNSASEFFSSIRDLVNQHAGDSSSSVVDSAWLGSVLPKNFTNITHGIETLGLDILNATGSVRTIFDASKPSSLSNGKGKESDSKDWVESDTDEQLMLFVPFQSAVKLHSIHITSLPPTVDEDEEDDEDEDDEAPFRPGTIKLFNTHQILGFEEADERQATQVVNLNPEDWNEEGTAVITTKFVKFQNCSGLTIFFVDVEREGGKKVRIDRLRMVGEITVEKVDMTKLKQQEE